MRKSLFLLTAFLLFASHANSEIKKMSYAGCTCVCNGDELAIDSNLVIVADSTQGLMFHYTADGSFAGYIGSAIQCKPSFPFRPLKIVSGYDGIHSLNVTERSVLHINSQGELLQRIPLSEANLGSSTPTSYTWGNDLNFISFANSQIVSCNYDLAVENSMKLPNVVSLSFSNDRLYALTSKGEVKTFTDQLESVDNNEKFGWLEEFLKNPQDIFADSEDNIWIADTGNRRVVVLWADGMFSTWGDQARSFEINEINGDPILGTSERFTPRRVAAVGDYFFMTTPDHNAYSIPIANLSTRQDPSKRRFVKLTLPSAHYRENLQAIWDLAQELYPQTSMAVELTDGEEQVQINWQKVDDSSVDFITDAQLRDCLMEQTWARPPTGFTITSGNGAVYIKCNRELDRIVFVKLFTVSGGSRPFILDVAGEGVLAPDQKSISIDGKKTPDSIFLVTMTDSTGKFVDFAWVR